MWPTGRSLPAPGLGERWQAECEQIDLMAGRGSGGGGGSCDESSSERTSALVHEQASG